MFVDSHAHIDGEEFDADREEVLARACESGVRAILNVGTGDPHSGTLERAVALAERFEDVYAAVGVHPHDARLYDDAAERRLRDILRSSVKVVALGEIGLDFHYDNSPRDVQREVFARQLRMARELRLPVVIHSREADAETVEVLRAEYAGAERGGVMHCFGGSGRMAEEVIELGFHISFAGNVTFKKAENLREVARTVPSERLLVETDCPFLAPVPLRGRRNEPAYVVETARFVAALRGVEPEELGSTTSENFARLFGVVLS
ncbi:MAG: TatD DNase family protein [Acidobacteriota bacterium]|jgi:TatD DNase family protein|nr:TatD DNase family protein [Acidobacteriota bacterium]